jgi:hypothetical protein
MTGLPPLLHKNPPFSFISKAFKLEIQEESVDKEALSCWSSFYKTQLHGFQTGNAVGHCQKWTRRRLGKLSLDILQHWNLWGLNESADTFRMVNKHLKSLKTFVKPCDNAHQGESTNTAWPNWSLGSGKGTRVACHNGGSKHRHFFDDIREVDCFFRKKKTCESQEDSEHQWPFGPTYSSSVGVAVITKIRENVVSQLRQKKHNTADCRAIAKAKQRKNGNSEAKAVPGKKSLAFLFEEFNSLKKQLNTKIPNSKKRKIETVRSNN